ncbi:B3 domain-containing protein REM5-like, partial [Olea europaea var. sylvestris]
ELPTAFSLQFKGPPPERAYLIDRNMNLWLVKMAKIGNDLFFCDGWEKFVQDNSVEAGDIFVFRYDGFNLFDVKLLGLSGCDKKGFGHSTNEEDGEAPVEKVTQGRPVQRPLSPYGDDIFRSGLAIRPRNPYFVTKIRKSRKDDLYIPKETIKDFQLDNLPGEMFLIDPQDRRFPAKIVRWKDERVWCKGGWKSLCAVNFVRPEDRCICEFVDGNLSIKFVRGNN